MSKINPIFGFSKEVLAMKRGNLYAYLVRSHKAMCISNSQNANSISCAVRIHSY